MRILFYSTIALGCIAIAPQAFAYPEITLRYQHSVFTLDPDAYPTWKGTKEVWMLHGKPIVPPARLLIDGDDLPPLPPGVIRSRTPAWNRSAMMRTLLKEISPKINRAARSVTIRRSRTGGILFDGVGMLGRTLNVERATELLTFALEQNITDIVLPIEETQPEIRVLDEALKKQGIREIVAVGESVFAGSPLPRRHNIAVGLGKWNGQLLPKGADVSFNAILGRVDESAGYFKELVILGEHTLPEFGGGLCQVSTTAYRGVWEYGFPILQRRNHSFAVTYYAPQGTDATIYPPHTDMVFRNDGPSALLVQTHQENGRAYFIYYGTRDSRQSEVVGPYLWDFRDPPPDYEEFTDELPPGEQRKASDRHPGVKALWYRIVTPENGSERTETVYSSYEARGFLTQIGAPREVPDWIGPVKHTEASPRASP